MELKIYRDTVTSMNTLGDIRTEIPMETEILIPDYLSAVFKIVKTMVHRVVLQKQLQNGHLLIEGYFRLEVFYQGEDQKLCTVEQKVAFSKQVDLKNAEDIQQSLIDIDGEVQYINCRAVNQRRLDLRGAYHLNIHLAPEHQRAVVTALSDGGIQQKQLCIPLVRVQSTREKQFNAEEDFNFQQQPEQILHTHITAAVQDIRIVAGKAVVKGEFRTGIVYYPEQSPVLCHQELTVPFNQVVEMENIFDGAEYQAIIEPIGCSIGSTGESEQTHLTCTALLTVRSIDTVECMAVADCFSTEYQTQVSEQALSTETLLEILSNAADVRLDGKLSDDVEEILDCFVECMAPELFEEGGNTAVRGKITAHILCKNALGEIDCYDKTADYILPKRYEFSAENITACLHATAESMGYSIAKNQAKVDVTVRVSGFLCRRQAVNIVDDVICMEPLEKTSDVALRVYYASAGEDVFRIAKRYHASPQAVCALAEISGDTLLKDTRLLIPQI